MSDALFEVIAKNQNVNEYRFEDIMELLQNNTFSRDELILKGDGIKNIHYGDILIKYGASIDIHKDKIPVIKSDVSVKKYSFKSYLKNGDVVFADTAEDYAVGKATEIVNAEGHQILSGLHTIPCRPKKHFAPMFLGYYFNSSLYRTQIYPIVQGTDNDYYLTHSFEKEEIKCGSIFMEAENASDFSDDNTFIYGHNMKDKSMFAKLNQFKDKQIYKENPEFLIYTENAIYRYSIFSCYVADISWDSFNYQFATEDAYGEWLQAVKNRSIYDTGVTPQKDQKTVTLMTCTPSGENYRFLVHGALAEVIQPKEK